MGVGGAVEEGVEVEEEEVELELDEEVGGAGRPVECLEV